MTRPPRAVPVRLARSSGGLLMMPAVCILIGVAAIAVALLALEGGIVIALAAAGAVAILLGAALAAVLLSIRVEVTDTGLRVASLLGSRDHALAPGPVTRVTLTGPQAVPLRARLGGRAWAYGRALLRGDEPIRVVRLAPVDAIVLVPTDLGRLAIAPQSERSLLEGLAEIGRHLAMDDDEPAVAQPDQPHEVAPPSPPEPEPIPRLLTGIERSIITDLLEMARLEEEAAAAQRAIEEAAAGESAEPRAQIAPPSPAPEVKVSPDRRRWFRLRSRPAPTRAEASSASLARSVSVAPPVVGPGEVELHAPEPEPAPQVAAPPAVWPGEIERHAPEPEPAPQVAAPVAPEAPAPEPIAPVATTPVATATPIAPEAPVAPATPAPQPVATVATVARAEAPARRRRRRSRLRRRIDHFVALPPASRVLGIMLIALPVGVAATGWFAADRLGTLPGTMEGRRSVALALLLVGPITALAAILARAASPRLVGLVLLSAAVAIVIVGRALMP